MNRLGGKTALVIGSATGIGREVARLFAAEGAAVALADHDQAALAEAVRLAGAQGRPAYALAVDVTREAEVAAAIAQAVERFGRLDILVNNAGVGGGNTPLHEQSAEIWQRVLKTNLLGVAYGMKHVVPQMKAQRYGRIINTASQLAHKPSPLNAMYCASKAAVVALTVSVAQEVALDGITVNAVCPGPTDTPMWRSSDAEWNRRKLESLPMKRVGQPVEIAWAYVYLASDEASYCTGQSLSPNGGDVMW
jgi:NAD(P)-dependent dehydrogenase (short-subunit alcohol dehydrogenase family)